MRRLVRSLAVLTAVGLLLATAVLLILLIEVPSPGDLQKDLPRIKKPLVVRPSRSGSVPLAEIEPGRPAPLAEPAPTDLFTNYLLRRYLEGAGSPVRVCESLSSSRAEPIVDQDSLLHAIEGALTGTNRDDPFLESLLAPLGASLRKPAVGALVLQAQAARDSGHREILSGQEFNSRLALAAVEMVSFRIDLERVSQHAYHLYVISRAIELNPQMLTDPRTQDLCQLIQTALSAAAVGTETNRRAGATPGSTVAEDLTFSKEKAAVLRFLAAAQLSPAEVDYDPNLEATSQVDISPRRLVIHTPWVDRILQHRGPRQGSASGATRATSPPGQALNELAIPLADSSNSPNSPTPFP